MDNDFVCVRTLNRLKKKLDAAYAFHTQHDELEGLCSSSERHISEQEQWFAEGILASIDVCEELLQYNKRKEESKYEDMATRSNMDKGLTP